MADRTMPTPGPWWVQGSNVMAERESGFGANRASVANCGGYVSNGRDDVHEENEANATLIAAAGTAASEVAEMGYDPIEAVRALPKLLKHSARLRHFLRNSLNAGPMGNNPKSERAILNDLYTALDRASGKEGE